MKTNESNNLILSEILILEIELALTSRNLNTSRSRRGEKGVDRYRRDRFLAERGR